MKLEKYVIGVDGGGTKTVAALASLEGRILKRAKTWGSSPRNVGPKKAAENVAQAVKKVLRKGKILSTFVGLPAVQEVPELARRFRKEFLKQKGISRVLAGKLEIGSDQIVAFRAGTDQDGVLIIAGTGSVAHGWRQGKEIRACGYQWLNDEGSAFWTGQQAFQAILKDLDRRGPKTLITKTAFRRFKTKTLEEFLERIYSGNPVENVPLLSVITDDASRKGDRVAKKIMEEAGQELALSVKTVVKGLRLQKKEFPLVLVGGMFKSKIIEMVVKKETKKIAPKVKFIRPKKDPVVGAVKLAIERIKM